MEFKHVPILKSEVLELLAPSEGETFVDGTLGGGGHAKAICERLGSTGRLIGIDRDGDALEAAKANLGEVPCKVSFIKDEYSRISGILEKEGCDAIDGALLDLGVSSYQIDCPERGFSYINDGPLDMRMDKESALDAKTVVNTYSEAELSRIIREYGEERWAGRIAARIVREREAEPIESTGRLSEIIRSAVPGKASKDGSHPAKRTFQAIRIEVNVELAGLEAALEDFTKALRTGGRIAVITFHSLEDRIVKRFFSSKSGKCTCPPDFPVCVCEQRAELKVVNRKPITASPEELRENPRAKSAKLRVAEKL